MKIENAELNTLTTEPQPSYEELHERVMLAEKVMSHTWTHKIIPNGPDIVYPLKEYKDKYPKALQPL